MLLFKPASIQAWLGKLASASLASLSLTSAMALLPHGHILPSLSHPVSGSRWGACRRWRLLEGLYSGFKWAQTLLCSLASPPLLSHEVIRHPLPSKWGVYYKWTSGICYFHVSTAFVFTDTSCSEDCATAVLWMFREPTRVRGVTGKLLCGRKISPGCLQGKSSIFVTNSLCGSWSKAKFGSQIYPRQAY